jgi:hypothetical protein
MTSGSVARNSDNYTTEAVIIAFHTRYKEHIQAIRNNNSNSIILKPHIKNRT